MADSAALVVALSAQLTKFEKDMRDAGIMAEKTTKDIEGKFTKMNPQVSSSFLGNFFSNIATKAIDGAVKAIEELIDRFKELQKTAEYAGASMQWVYGLQQAFMAGGASAAQANKFIESITLQLDQMQRGNTTNALATLFSANNVSGIKTTQQALDAIATIVQNLGNTPRKIEVVEALGGVRDLVPTLEKGASAMNAIADASAKSAPDLERVANQSKAMAKYFGDIWTTIKEWSLDVAHSFLAQLVADIANFAVIVQDLLKQGPLEAFGNKFLEKATAAADEYFTTSQEKTGAGRIYVGRQTGTGKAVDPFGLNAPKADTKDAYDREVASINKHIAAMQADAATVGESAFAQEEFRVQMLLSEKAAEANKDMTLELNDAIAAQATRAAQAKQALAENQFQLQKMNAASQTVGQALSSSFTDAIVEGKKLNEVFADLIKTLEKAALNSLIMSFFTPGAGQSQSWFSSILPKFAEGTSSAPGGMAVVGERGPSSSICRADLR